MRYYFVYAGTGGNSEMCSDKPRKPEDYADQRMHYGDSSGMHSMCHKYTRSSPFKFRKDLEMCQTCVNNLERSASKQYRKGRYFSE